MIRTFFKTLKIISMTFLALVMGLCIMYISDSSGLTSAIQVFLFGG